MTAPVAAGLEQDVLRALARAALYRLLGAAFAYPTAPRLEELGRAALAAVAGPGLDPAMRPSLAAFAEAARASDEPTLAGEYVFLFDRQVRCPPYEGAYGDAPQMAGKAAGLADIAGFYAAFGLQPAGAQPQSEDHVTAELEFMSALALKEAWALSQGASDGLQIVRDAQAAFVRDHLGRWTAAFAGELRGATPLPFYTTGADLLEAWMAAECAALGIERQPASRLTAADPVQEETFTCPMAGEAEPGEPSDPR